jgi:sporulation related protein
MNDLADEGFHEIQLNGKQLVFLFMLTAIVLVGTFLLGVGVGRGVKADRAVEGGDVAASATMPPAAATPSQPAAAGGPPAAEPPAPAPEPDDELSYAKRLQGDQSAAPAEKLKSPSPAAPAEPAASKNTPAAQAPPATVAAPGKPAAPPPAQAPAAAAENAGRPGAFIVQVTALQDRNAAMTIVRSLTGKGYPAFVQDPAPGSPKIYRVQVGGYPDRDKAEQISRQLATQEQFKAYVRSR